MFAVRTLPTHETQAWRGLEGENTTANTCSHCTHLVRTEKLVQAAWLLGFRARTPVRTECVHLFAPCSQPKMPQSRMAAGFQSAYILWATANTLFAPRDDYSNNAVRVSFPAQLFQAQRYF